MSYRIETTTNEKALFEVDAAYIIHLEGNGRLDSVKEQMAKHAIAPTVHLVFNKGYNDPKKKLPSRTTTHDIVDAYKYVFRDAEQQDYNNVLVLEDDFFFRPDLAEADVGVVNQFLQRRKKQRFVYHLGCIPALMVPVDAQGNYLVACSSTHASVYSRSVRSHVLRYTGAINDWDWYLTFQSLRYAYTKPLIYQLYPETENSKNWMPVFGFTFFVKLWIKILKLDVQPEPGYAIIYTVAKAAFYGGVVAFVVLLSMAYHYDKVLAALEKVGTYLRVR